MKKVGVVLFQNLSDNYGTYFVYIEGVENSKDDEETRIKLQKIIEENINKLN